MNRTPTIAKQRPVSAAQSWDLLRSGDQARVAVLLGGQLEIFPVTYSADRDQLVFHAQEGAPLRALLGGAQAVFEADGRHGDVAWSVVVTGRTRLLELPADRSDPAAPGHPQRVAHVRGLDRQVVLTPDSVTGRKVATDDLSQWGWF